jgi:hypothetical protein
MLGGAPVVKFGIATPAPMQGDPARRLKSPVDGDAKSGDTLRSFGPRTTPEARVVAPWILL